MSNRIPAAAREAVKEPKTYRTYQKDGGLMGWRLWLCRIGVHTRTEQNLFTMMCGVCHKDIETI